MIKKTMIIAALITFIAAGLYASGNSENISPLRGQGYGAGRGQRTYGNQLEFGNYFVQELKIILEGIPFQEIDDKELNDLLYMWEEEKFARDVYAKLYEMWNYPIFNNISRSEAQHMTSIELLMERYSYIPEDIPTSIGVFNNSKLAALYESFIEQGAVSLASALTIGATIEDLDIADLLERVERSDNDDIRIIFQNLMKGSRNHMRAFLRLLNRQGAEYMAQYISQDYMDSFLPYNQEQAPIASPDYSF